ncbi:bZIP transcription factor [Aspergillus undulatus]|uniref:bZIP transcription factor n=1 Tax=Aspergillus undulatus TaxID=1810928 RepID=UPI003CCC9F97
MPAIIMMNQAAPTPNPEKKPKKRVITEARKIQNREAQRAYRLRQKERLRALKEAHEQDSRSSSAYHELRPQPPVGKWTDAYIPIPPPSWTFPIQGVGVVEGDSQSEIISPLANGQPQDLNLTAAAAAVNLNLNLNLNLTADPLSVPLPGSNLATPDGSIGDGSIGVPEPQSFPGLVDMDSMEGPTTEIDPLLTGLKFFPQSGSDLDSHVSSIDGFLGHVDESLLLSFQHDGSGSSSSSSNIHADANYSLNNPPIPHSSSDVPHLHLHSQTQPQLHPDRLNLHPDLQQNDSTNLALYPNIHPNLQQQIQLSPLPSPSPTIQVHPPPTPYPPSDQTTSPPWLPSSSPGQCKTPQH